MKGNEKKENKNKQKTYKPTLLKKIKIKPQNKSLKYIRV